MSSFDEARLDDAAALDHGDPTRLLWALATAGAQVRHAIETVSEFGLDRLAGEGPPRSVLVATDVPGVARVLTKLTGAAAPSVAWRGADLPRWAGASDVLLVAAQDGRHPRLAGLCEQAARRGLLLAVAAPLRSPVADAAGRQPVSAFGVSGLPGHPRATRWAALTPLLQAAHTLGQLSATDAVLREIADALDATAETCRPGVECFLNPAKTLALDLAEAPLVVAGAGALAGTAARQIAESVQLLAGRPAVALGLPEGMAVAGALLSSPTAGSADTSEDDFFRDRTEDAEMRPRLLLLGDDGDPSDPLLGDGRTDAQIQLDEVAARRAAQALRQVADVSGVRTSGVDVPASVPLARYAAATAFGDLTAAYLAIGAGFDPGAPRPGEIAADSRGF